MSPPKPKVVEVIPETPPSHPTPGRHLVLWGTDSKFYGLVERSDSHEEWLLYEVTSFFCGQWNENQLIEDQRRSGVDFYRLVVADWFEGGGGNEVFTGQLERAWTNKPTVIQKSCHMGAVKVGPATLTRSLLTERFFVFGTQKAGYAAKHDGNEIHIHKILVPWSEAEITQQIEKGLWFTPDQLAQHDLLRGHFSLPQGAHSPGTRPTEAPSAHLKLADYILSIR